MQHSKLTEWVVQMSNRGREISGRQKIIIGVGRSLYGHRSEGPLFGVNAGSVSLTVSLNNL